MVQVSKKKEVGSGGKYANGQSISTQAYLMHFDIYCSKHLQEVAARMIQLWWEHPLTNRGTKSLKRKSLYSIKEIALFNRAMSSNRTKMKMTELYRKLYLDIESLRKYILSGVDIEEQFTSKNSDERTIAALIADVKKVVNDVKEDVRQSVKKVANQAGAPLRQMNTPNSST
jgi:hypothetical protein